MMPSLINRDVRRALDNVNRHYAPVERPPRALAYMIVASLMLFSFCAGMHYSAQGSAQHDRGGRVGQEVVQSSTVDGQGRR